MIVGSYSPSLFIISGTCLALLSIIYYRRLKQFRKFHWLVRKDEPNYIFFILLCWCSPLLVVGAFLLSSTLTFFITLLLLGVYLTDIGWGKVRYRKLFGRAWWYLTKRSWVKYHRARQNNFDIWLFRIQYMFYYPLVPKFSIYFQQKKIITPSFKTVFLFFCPFLFFFSFFSSC